MTAHAMKGDQERCLEAGMDACVAKPINPVSLFALVNRVCGERNREAALLAISGPSTVDTLSEQH